MDKRIIGLLAVGGLLLALFVGGSASGAPEQQGQAAEAASAGWQEIEGARYYFLEDGTPASGWQEIEGKRYNFRETGSMVTGWLSLEGQRYYLLPDGSAARGVCPVDGTDYLFSEDGCLSSGWVTVSGKRYYGATSCRPLTGWQEIDGIGYSFSEEGWQNTGWLERDGFRYYFFEDGTPAQGRATVDGASHTFAFNGQEVILVNPWNTIPQDYTVSLVEAENTHLVAEEAYPSFLEMMEDCRAAGLQPVVCSGYRTQEYQQMLYDNRIQRWIATGLTQEEATEKAGLSVAVPGTSEHQLGLALDIIDTNNWHLDRTQAEMPTQQWLMEHSWEYGWILRYPDECSEVTGIIYEPWHYRYVGKVVAADIHASGLCLEEYLLRLTRTVG